MILDQIIENEEGEINKMIEETLKEKKYDVSVWLTRFPKVDKYIKDAKEKICEITIDQRKKIEIMIDILEKKSYNKKPKIKKGVGRPKKNITENKEENNMDIRKYMNNLIQRKKYKSKYN